MVTQLPSARPRPSLLQRRIVRSFTRDAAQLVPVMRRDLLRDFRLLGRLGQRVYLRLTPRAIRQIDPGDTDLVNAINRSLFAQDPLAHFEQTYRTSYLRTLNATVGTVELHLGVAVGVPDPLARQIVAEGGRRLGLVDIRGQTRTALFHALAEGREQGLAREQLGRHILGRIERGPWRTVQTRAQVIARTETAHAQRVSAVETYKRTPIVTGALLFDAQITANTDAECIERDGLVVSFADADRAVSDEHPLGTLSIAPHIGR